MQSFVERFLAFQAERKAEKDLRKEQRKNVRPTDMMRRLADLDAGKSSAALPGMANKMFPVCTSCVFQKELTPWSLPPIGGLQFETHALANFANEGITLIQYDKLLKLMKDPKRGVDRRTRTFRLKKHKDCFVGMEACQWLTQTLGLISTEEALAIGECLMHRFLSSFFFLHFQSLQTPSHQFSKWFSPLSEV